MQLKINQEQKEIKSHGSYEFPLLISHEALSNFETFSFPWHWHPEIELTYVTEGDISYQVNETVWHLSAGEGLFCNTNVLHSGHRLTQPDCRYLSVTFHPRLLYGYSSSVMQHKYVNPVLNNGALSSIHFTRDNEWMRQVLEEMERILQLDATRPDSMELQLQICILSIWQQIYEHVEHQRESMHNDKDTERIRKIIEFIQMHYMENITLEMLAGEVHLCKSESCRMFKRYMSETMFDYLNRYRIERSLELLRNRSLSVTQVAEQVGFASPGYFSRIFRERMGVTPLAYRKQFPRDGIRQA